MVNEAEIASRLAVIENQIARDKEDRDHRHKELDDKLECMQRSMDRLCSELGKYKGFVGGVSLVISVLWAGIAFFKEHIIKTLN